MYDHGNKSNPNLRLLERPQSELIGVSRKIILSNALSNRTSWSQQT